MFRVDFPLIIDFVQFFLYFFELTYIKNFFSLRSSRAFKYHGIGRFKDDLYAINKFLNYFMYLYPKAFELKTEHQCTHRTCFDLETTIEVGMLIYKLYDKLDEFPIFIVRIPHLPNNIPSSIFYGLNWTESELNYELNHSELLRIGDVHFFFLTLSYMHLNFIIAWLLEKMLGNNWLKSDPKIPYGFK